MKYKHIYFIGIGGISMSSLASIVLSEGIKISGSDKVQNDLINHLRLLGATIFINHSEKNLSNLPIKPDLVVYTSAIDKENEELYYAIKNNIPTMERGEFLGVISSLYKHTIAISGVHGKTTTTGMLASIFIKANLDPTIHIGGQLKNINSNVKIGNSRDFFITEACEYKENFLKLNPDTAVILNIEYDHPDYYKDFNHILKSFQTFASQSKNVVISENFKNLLPTKNMTTISLNCNSTYKASNIRKYHYGTSFYVLKNGEFWGKVKTHTYGKHNVYNALFCIAVSEIYNIDKQYIIDGLYDFAGIKRRFDFWGKKDNSLILHDYAHHPTEIKAVISTCKEYFKLPVITFFQPHTYSRTKKLFSEFLSAFDESDFTYILPTYPAREIFSQGYSGQYLYKNLKLKNKNTKYVKFNSAIKSIKSITSNKCIILILGAGDIDKMKQYLDFNK